MDKDTDDLGMENEEVRQCGPMRAATSMLSFGRLWPYSPSWEWMRRCGRSRQRRALASGTLYRHFPQRSDLIKAIIRREVDACVEAASTLAAAHEPGEALASWMQCLIDLVATKRGLGPALHSGDPAYQALPDYVLGQLTPALRGLLDAAAAAGIIRADVDASELLFAGASARDARQHW